MPTSIDFELFAELARSDNPVEHAQKILGVSREHALKTVADWLEWRHEAQKFDLAENYQRQLQDAQLDYLRKREKYLS